MTKSVDAMFVLAGAIFLLAGMGLGEVMAASQDHSQLGTHAHLNLPGGVFAILFGLAYRAWPSLKTNLALIHLGMHIVGTLVMVTGLWMIFGPTGATPPGIALATLGSIFVVLGMLLFAIRIAGKIAKPE
jgi:hypothetical protein